MSDVKRAPLRSDYPRSVSGARAYRDAWRTWHLARVAACSHAYNEPRWAGILGWRYHCESCGDMFNPDRHTTDDGCRYHPAGGMW